MKIQMKTVPAALPLAASFVLATLMPAFAQDASQAFRGFSSTSNDPIQIEADRLEVRDQEKIAKEAALDGLYVIRTSVPAEVLETEFTVRAYKDLSKVERAFRCIKTVDLKVRPIYHYLDDRIRAHVFLCILALLLKRIFEINYLGNKSTMEPLEELSKSKLIKYKVRFSEREERTQIIPKITTTTPIQKKYFNMIGIKNPMSLARFVW